MMMYLDVQMLIFFQNLHHIESENETMLGFGSMNEGWYTLNTTTSSNRTNNVYFL